MRVLHVLHSLTMGGLERVVVSVANGLARRGLPQAVCCLHDRGCLLNHLDKNIQVHLLDARPNDPTLPFKLAAIYRSFGPDVVETADFCSWPDTSLAALGSRRVRLAHTFHGFLDHPPRRHRWTGRILAARTHRLKAVSSQLARRAAEAFGIRLDRIEILPNGVDIGRFNRDSVDPAPNQRAHQARLTCVTIASIKPAKDPLLLVDVARRLGPDVHFIWVGEGTMQQELALRTRQAGVSERFTLTGEVDDVRPYLAAADLFVLPSRTEAAPVAVLEAMAMGLPVVATRTGDLDQMVEDTGAGTLTPAGDAESLALAIDCLGGDDRLRASMARSARTAALERFSTEAMLDRYQRGYEQMCQGLSPMPAAALRAGGG
ncbi:MAG: glycosyltransferase [Phycisphaerae bacterium]